MFRKRVETQTRQVKLFGSCGQIFVCVDAKRRTRRKHAASSRFYLEQNARLEILVLSELVGEFDWTGVPWMSGIADRRRQEVTFLIRVS